MTHAPDERSVREFLEAFVAPGDRVARRPSGSWLVANDQEVARRR